MRNTSKKIIIALIAIFFIGVGISFNAAAMLGNDPIGILYDGVRAFLNLTETQLGTAVYIVNFLVAVAVFIFGKHYINVGTFIYVLPYGFFVSIGTMIYNNFLSTDIFIIRCLIVILGCFLIYLGVAMFILVDIGLDPFTGLTMVFKDKLNWTFRKTKISFDLVLTVIGFLLGGTLGVITILTAFAGGPCIDFIEKQLKKVIKF